ncbi:MAG: hypothetical protein K2K00_11165 [Muribaculaceae bacterium]|nr:hypothetical protein [Muribaculaceae bacterium]
MKLNSKQFLTAAAALLAVLASSCKDDVTDTLSARAYIEPDAFYVPSAVDKTRIYKAQLNATQDTFFIRVPQNVDPVAELTGAVPSFYLSLGGSVTPPMTEAQNFADLVNPPKYTVTSADGGSIHTYVVSYTVVDPQPMDFGEAPANIDRYAVAKVGENGFGFNGDIIGSPAFCGMDHVAMFSRKYNTIRIYDLPSLTVSETQLNTAPFALTDVVAVTSDSKGNLVVAVGGYAAGHTKFYYYTAPDAEPVELNGETHTSVEYEPGEAAMMGTYISCTGDITGQAVIAFGGERDELGTHYKYYVTGGYLRTDNYETIHTGYPSNDMNEFQMISFFSTKKNSAYLVGDCQKSDKQQDGMLDEVTIRVNDNLGNTIAMADYYNPAYNSWEGWWQRSGQATVKKGARRPTVHAMNLNGVELSLFSTGGGPIVDSETKPGEKGGAPQLERTLITDKNLGVYYTDYNAFEGTWLIKLGTEEAAPWIDYASGAGMMCDWCFDDEKQQGYIAVFYERRALMIYNVSCIKML